MPKRNGEPTKAELKKAEAARKKEEQKEIEKVYHRYIRSMDFDWIREAVEERDGCCQVCGRTREDIEGTKISFNCHHRCYDHLGESSPEEMEDCILLCSVCHRSIHQAPSNWARFKDKSKVMENWKNKDIKQRRPRKKKVQE